jgi:hypothetical protein
MRARPILLLFLLSAFVVADLCAEEIPLVYDVENTGAGFAKPVLPAIGELKTVAPLTDPFEWSDGSGRDRSFAGWNLFRTICR